ncbi:MAG: peptidylprolyl isomerase [Firmicutes bacterium]|nr:peptidylprolyl isomerase [Bacillota bacterium]
MKKMLAVILSVIFLLCGCGDMSDESILKIDGENIKTSEYMIYLYEQMKSFEETGGEDIWEMKFDGVDAQEVAKQNAVNSLMMVKNAVKRSDTLNIYINDEDEKKIKDESSKLYEEMGEYAKENGISREDVEKTVRESTLQEKVFEFITSGFEISRADFDSYFENYCEENKKELKDISVKYLFKKCDTNNEESREEIEGIYERILTSGDFDSIAGEDPNGKTEAEDIDECELPEEIKDAAYNMNEGDISGILESAEGFYIIKAESVEEADIEKLKSEIEKIYTDEKKKEIYSKQNEIWSKDTTVEKNDGQWNSIKIGKGA